MSSEPVELVFESIRNPPTYDDVSIETKEEQHCWCCGYSSSDLTEVVLEDSLRKKKTHIVCGLCLEAPYVLDAYLNPWLYENNSREILSTMTFMMNRLLDAVQEKDKK